MTFNHVKEKIVTFVREVIAETKKVSWSNKQEFLGSTVVVVFSIMVMSLFIGLVDFLLSRIFNFIM